MATSKPIPIFKPFANPINGKVEYLTPPDVIKKLGLVNGDDLTKYDDELDKVTLADILSVLFDNITCKSNTLLFLYRDIMKLVKESKENKTNHIQMTLSECQQLKSIFVNSPIQQPSFNSYFLFVIESFDDFIKNFDSLAPIETIPEISS